VLGESLRSQSLFVAKKIMKQQLSMITLGVSDPHRAGAFYEALGWQPHGHHPDDDIVFFQTGDGIVALWDRGKLAADSAVQDTPGWGGATLALLVESPEEVDAILQQAEAAGARLGRAGSKRPWGGYSGVFIDPDGHPWEIAWNPAWRLTDDGGVALS
jgi:catechol 2,3-dioxygenase-like lactoylglutathione lyase family enzyme